MLTRRSVSALFMMWPFWAAAKDGGDKGDSANKDDKDDADDKDDDGPSTKKAESRFPQPVRVGALIGRQVLEPTEAQHVLGRVTGLVRSADGKVSMIMTIGGLFGFDTRLIAVPIEAVVLLGQYVAVVDFKPKELDAFPTASLSDATSLNSDDMIRVGLTRPFH